MATPATVNPFNFYPGRDGLPLQNGYLYFGEPFQDPELQPLQAYWDDANTQPAARPIRTINGYPARNGTPAQVFVAAQYSMRVRDSQGREVFYAPNVTAVDLGGGGLDIITASGGQTVVNLTNAVYTPGSNAIDVSLNGLILISGQDYFETGTDRITMASALSAGDQIRAFARSTFGLTQAVLSDWQAEVFNGDGTASQNFTLTRNPGAVANLDVSVTTAGVGSTLRPLIDYTLSGQVVTITPAPPAASNNVLIRYGRSLPQDALRGELASTASAADGDALVGSLRSETGSVASTVHLWIQRSRLPLTNFLTNAEVDDIMSGTGSIDVAAKFNTALSAAAGKILQLPYGKIRVGSALTNAASGAFVEGEGVGTKILSSSATAHVFDLGDGSSEIRNLCFANFSIWATGNKTAGACFRARKLVRSMFEDVYMGTAEDFNADGNWLWDGLTVAEFDNVAVRGGYCLTDNDGIVLYGNSGQTFGAEFTIGNGIRILRQAQKGIHVAGGAGGVKLGDLDVSACQFGLYVSDDLGGAFNREIQIGARAFFDSCTTGSGRGVFIDTNGLFFLQWDGASANSNVVGLQIQPSQPAGAKFLLSNPAISTNTSEGLIFNDGKLVITGGAVSGNGTTGGGAHGISIATANTEGINIDTCSVNGNGNGTSGYNINIVAGCDFIDIAHNDLTGGGQGPINNGSGYATTRRVIDNLGALTRNEGTATVLNGNTKVTVSHGLIAAPPIGGIVFSRIGPANGTFEYVTNVTATTFDIELGGAATANRDFAWKANFFGS